MGTLKSVIKAAIAKKNQETMDQILKIADYGTEADQLKYVSGTTFDLKSMTRYIPL